MGCHANSSVTGDRHAALITCFIDTLNIFYLFYPHIEIG
jgi:hypothetical protein